MGSSTDAGAIGLECKVGSAEAILILDKCKQEEKKD
jgi:hypothetical protein